MALRTLGRIRLIVGDEERLLGQDETAEFDTGNPRRFGPTDNTVAKLLHLTRRDE